MSAERLEGQLVALSSGRTKTGRSRMSALVRDDDGAVWLVLAYTGRNRAALAALAPGDPIAAHGIVDRERLRLIVREVEGTIEPADAYVAPARMQVGGG